MREWGEPREFDFEPKPHWEIGVALDIIDFERATRIAGANFEVFKGAGARLRRALINFMLDLHTRSSGYTEVAPPMLARRDALIASGHLPKFEDDQFHVRENDMFLIPTAESALANLHRDEILDGASSAAALCRLHAVLPVGEVRRGQGIAGADPPVPVRQGGAVQVRGARNARRRNWNRWCTRRSRSTRSWASPTGWR